MVLNIIILLLSKIITTVLPVRETKLKIINQYILLNINNCINKNMV